MLIKRILQRCVWIFLFFFLCSYPIDLVSPQKAFSFFEMSESQEIRLGQQTHKEILEEYGMYDNPSLNAYVNEVGQRLAKVSHRNHLQFHFTVLDSPIINAFAVPGGYVYITRGSLATFNSEAEMANVIGHEIGHITAKHSVKQISRTQTYSILSTIIASIDKKLATAKRISDTAAGLVFLKYNRDNERESDQLGMEYAVKAGYNPKPMADFLETLLRKEKEEAHGSLPGFLSTHPTTNERIDTVKIEADQLSRNSRTLTKTGYNEYKSRIDGMVYGPGEREGIIERGVYKNRFGGIAVAIPQGWQKQQSRLIFMTRHPYRNYLFELHIHELRGRTDAYAFAGQVERKIGLPRGSFQRISLNGFEGIKGTYRGKNRSGEILRITVFYLLEHDKNIGYTLLTVNPERESQNADYYLSAILRSFRRLSPAEIDAIPVRRIAIHTAQKGESFFDISKRYYGDPNKAKEIADFNGLTANTKLLPGEKLKIIVP